MPSLRRGNVGVVILVCGDANAAVSGYQHSLDLWRQSHGEEYTITGWGYCTGTDAFLAASDLPPPFDSMLKLEYYTVEHDSHFDEAATFRRDSLEVLRELPEEVKDEIGFALERVQRGKMPENAKPLKGIAPGVLEIVSDFRGDTFRAVYTVKFPKAVYVLHVFQKKSKRGIATPRHEMKLVEKRLAQVVVLEKPSRKNLG